MDFIPKEKTDSTIAEAAQKSGLSPHTIRYYDKEGLLPFVKRSAGGIRMFKDSDLEWLSLVICLKYTGMSIKQIKTFMRWCIDGDKTLKQRHETFIRQKQKVEQQIALLNKHLEKINYKIQYYKAALDAGTEEIHTKKLCLKENLRD